MSYLETTIYLGKSGAAIRALALPCKPTKNELLMCKTYASFVRGRVRVHVLSEQTVKPMSLKVWAEKWMNGDFRIVPIDSLR